MDCESLIAHPSDDPETHAAELRAYQACVASERARADYEKAKTQVGVLTPHPIDNFPYRVLGRVSVADSARNITTTKFDPKKRKIIVLMIAGLLLFVALINYD